MAASDPLITARFPRVSGDEPKTATPKQPHFKFSPRERG